MRYLQFHLLHVWPAGNPNRGQDGEVKTIVVNGSTRHRISSQSLKRAWRTSEVFGEACEGSLAKRSRRFGMDMVYTPLVAAGIPHEDAITWSKTIARQFGVLEKPKEGDPPELAAQTRTMVTLAPEEYIAVRALADTLANENRPPSGDDLKLLRHVPVAIDLALWGRMMAESPEFNVDAAMSVAHAVGVGTANVTDDYLVAVEELNAPGAGLISQAELVASTTYTYATLDLKKLVENLRGDVELAKSAIRPLLTAMTTTGPSGKRNSTGTYVRASYLEVWRGDGTPFSLVSAFDEPVDKLAGAVALLEGTGGNMLDTYGDEWDVYSMSTNGSGTLSEAIDFAVEAFPCT